MITLWHNPRCSKSRQALALLQDAGVPLVVRKYLEDAPNRAEIEAALEALGGVPPIEIMRRGEKVFKELGLSKNSTPEALLNAMAQHPILIERPIAFAEGKAAIGRPPENVLALV